MSSLYYLGVGVFSLASTIYNFEMFTEGKNVTCYSCKLMNSTEYANFVSRSGLNDSDVAECQFKESTTSYRAVLVEQTDLYKILALVIAIMYLLLLVLGLYMSCITNAFSNQTPDDFLKMGTCKQFFACFCKIFPPVILIISWVNFIIIIVYWILYVSEYCPEAIDRSPTASLDYSKYRKKHIPLLIVNSVIWLCLHCGGSIIREMTYIEPFMYNPDTGAPNCFRTFMLKKFGP